MKRLRIMKNILIHTKTSKTIIGFFLVIFMAGFLIMLVEPDIHTWSDGLWYCYATVTTIGFGDITVTSTISRFISVFLSIYATLVIALITGVIVNAYIQLIQRRDKATLAHFMDKLEHLPELSPEELKELSEKVTAFRNNYGVQTRNHNEE